MENNSEHGIISINLPDDPFSDIFSQEHKQKQTESKSSSEAIFLQKKTLPSHPLTNEPEVSTTRTTTAPSTSLISSSATQIDKTDFDYKIILGFPGEDGLMDTYLTSNFILNLQQQ